MLREVLKIQTWNEMRLKSGVPCDAQVLFLSRSVTVYCADKPDCDVSGLDLLLASFVTSDLIGQRSSSV